MKNPHPAFLQITYLIIFLILLLIIILTPLIIKEPINLTEEFIVEEEIVEASSLCILMFLSVLILNFYKKEVDKHKKMIRKIKDDKKLVEEKLTNSFSYIGKVNVQLEEIKSIFNSTNKYPETKNDFKKAQHFLCERILGMVNVEWTLLRIIDSINLRTINEYLEKRHGYSLEFPHISNKIIVERQTDSSFTSIISKQENLNIIVCCILPAETINKEQRTFIQGIVNQVSMLFIILNSSYYKRK